MAMKRGCFIAVVLVFLEGVCFAQSPSEITPREVEVVAEVGPLTNQTGRVSGTVFTPPQTGMFRVSFYVQCIKGDPINGKDLFPELGPVPDRTGGLPATFSFIIKDNGRQSIEWVVEKPPVDESVYEVYLALERIGPKVQ
jgi:hypothetical protein